MKLEKHLRRNMAIVQESRAPEVLRGMTLKVAKLLWFGVMERSRNSLRVAFIISETEITLFGKNGRAKPRDGLMPLTRVYRQYRSNPEARRKNKKEEDQRNRRTL